MSTHVQTTIESMSSTVVLIASSSVFVTQLTASLDALHLAVVRIEPELLIHTLQTEQGRRLFTEAYVCLYVDIPVFSDQVQKKNWIDHHLSQLSSIIRIPMYFVLFDARHRRKTGREGSDPISTSRYLAERATKLFEHAKLFEYHHVLYPYEGGLSLVQRMVFEKIQQGNRAQLLGDCTPVWYADVITHLVGVLCEVNPVSGIFSGKHSLPMYSLEENLRQRSHLPSIQPQALEFPYILETANGIGDTPIETMVEQLSLATPQPRSAPQADVQIHTPVLVPKKTTSVHKKKQQSLGTMIVKALVVVVGVLGGVYLCVTVYFFLTLLHTREKLSSFVQPSSGGMNVEDVFRIQKRLPVLHSISERVPIPYSLVGISLHGTEVTNSIENIQELLSGIEQSQLAAQKMLSITQGKEEDLTEAQTQITTHLEESYKELSQVQARLSQQDLSLDLLLGIDGFSRELLTRVSVLRESVSQQKAFSSVFTSLFTTQKHSTIAFVRADSTTARPLFGTPKEVVIVSVAQGKIDAIKNYSVEELDALLKGRVDPPEEMKTYTTDEEWHLADGAWSIDGATAARQLTWFLSKQLHTDIDALVMMDDDQVQRSAVSLESHEVSPLISQEPSNSNVLGAQAAVSDLNSVVRQVQEVSMSSLRSLATTLADAVSRAEMTVYVREAGGAKTMKALAWDGSILTPPCPPSFALERNCYVASLYRAEYDLTKGEHDAFATKKDEVHKIVISSEEILHTNEVVYSAPHETQRKLLKYVVDENATPTHLVINGSEQTITADMVQKEFGKLTIAVPLVLSQGEESRVALSYTTAPIASEKSSYAFFVQKQPGKEGEPFSLEVSYAKGYLPKIVAPQATIGRSSVSFSTTLDTNKLFAIGF